MHQKEDEVFLLNGSLYEYYHSQLNQNNSNVNKCIQRKSFEYKCKQNYQSLGIE